MMTTQQDLKEIREVFRSWDDDGNGILDPNEIRRHTAEIAQYFGMDESKIEGVIQAADTDKDGNIDFEEFSAAALDKKKHISRANIDKAFKMFDQNGDGKISPQELQSIFGNASIGEGLHVWEKIMEEVDANADGAISAQEFSDHMFAALDKERAYESEINLENFSGV